MSDESLYDPPNVELGVIKRCPQCKEPMEHGKVRSSSGIHWMGDEDSRLKNFITGGKSLMGKVKSFHFTSGYPGWYCETCSLVIFEEE